MSIIGQYLELEAKELHHRIELNWIESAMEIHLRENIRYMNITMKYLNYCIFKALAVWYIVYIY